MINSKDKLKVEWVAKDGNIFTKDLTEFKAGSDKKIQVPIYIAFNIGDSAEHIVALHNDSLKRA